ncbi:MAG: hypothetical protein ACOYB0_10575 [Polynucleobacter sp.]
MKKGLLITDNNEEEMVRAAAKRMQAFDLIAQAGCTKNQTPCGGHEGVALSTFRFPSIPRSEWRDIIRRERGTFLGDHTRGRLAPHDQGETNYCWGHGSVRTIETLGVYYGGPPRILSAESVCVPVTRGRNRGGSPEEALRQIVKAGACRQEFWPKNDLNVEHAKDGWILDAARNRIIQWVEVATFEDQMTLALRRIPVAIGLGWWGHLVCQLDPVYLDDLPNLDGVVRASGQFGIGFDNSWGADFGDKGYAYLDEKHATADLGAFAPLSVTFYG